MKTSIRKEFQEVTQDVARLIRKEITIIHHLSFNLAWHLMNFLDLKNAEVICIEMTEAGGIYSLVLIDGVYA